MNSYEVIHIELYKGCFKHEVVEVESDNPVVIMQTYYDDHEDDDLVELLTNNIKPNDVGWYLLCEDECYIIIKINK